MPRRRNWLAWLGLGLGLLAVLAYFAGIILRVGPRAPALRDTAVLHLALIGVALGVSAVAIRRALGRAATHRGRVLAPLLGVLNLAVAVFFILMLSRFSVLPPAPNAPQVGQAAPAFSLTDDRGTPIQLADLRGQNVLLVFYRGHW